MLVPFRETNPFNLLREFDSLFNDVGARNKHLAPSQSSNSSWTPTTDIKELENEYVLELELAGVDPKKVEVSVEGRTLNVKGEKETSKTDDTGEYHRVERTYGSFSRTFCLPESIDTEQITAKGEYGVLKITIPKAAETKPKRININ